MKIKLLTFVLVLGLVGSLSFVNSSYAKKVSPTPVELASLDSDKDGYSDLCEVLHQSDPNDKKSKPLSNITINVPSDVKTIQSAINVAIDGDTILVAQGKYEGNINFKGRTITLTSTDPQSPDVVANTIIGGIESGSVITIDTNSTITGFTITSGDLDCRGIYCSGASPTIENCTIIDNETTGSGGGIYISTTISRPKIINCIISENKDNSTGESPQISGGTPEISYSLIGQGLVNTPTTPETSIIPSEPTSTETGDLITDSSTSEEPLYQTTGTREEIHSMQWDSCNDRIDIFFLLDDTGSFGDEDSLAKTAFSEIISDITTRFPDVSFGFGIGRFEEYGRYLGARSDSRTFILNQPIITTDIPGFNDAITGALRRVAPGNGGDYCEPYIEGLYQVATGVGYDGNNNGNTTDSGPAGLYSTQTDPGDSGDVPAFYSFTPDPFNNVLSPAGTLGGVGFRNGALKIVILATDDAIAYQPDSPVIDPIIGAGGIEVPLNNFIQSSINCDSRNTTPFGTGAKIQETITALNDLGILVIGLGTNIDSNTAPRQTLEAISKVTGTINLSDQSLESGIPSDPIDPGNPLYFYLYYDGIGSIIADNLSMLFSQICTNPIWYVDDDATGDKNGTSWDDAFQYLQDALNNLELQAGDEIWVAEGTYKPDQGDNVILGDRTATFQLVDGVILEGGYAGLDYVGLGALSPNARDIEAYPTILSGHGNSYHVVTGSGTDATALIDGFTITGGDANSSPADAGGGMLNSGGNPTVANCIFTNNEACNGGGMANVNSSPTVKNCVFVDNQAIGYKGDWGGGMFNAGNSSPKVINCVFSNNWAYTSGGGIANWGGLPTITNCTFSGNSASGGGALYNHYGEYNSIIVTNCIFWGNEARYGEGHEILSLDSGPTFSHCDIEGGLNNSPGCAWGNSIDGDGNINADPLFFNVDNPMSHGLRLRDNSPCIDVANDDVAHATDILGRKRVDIPGVGNDCEPPPADMGAYERMIAVVWYVDDNATGDKNGTSWYDAFKYLQDALNNSQLQDDDEIWVAQGTYKPDCNKDNSAGTGDKTATFQLINGVTIKGGYAGFSNPSNPNAHDIKTYQTILSGDIGIEENNTDNSYCVLTGSGTDATTILDGFTIENGNSYGSGGGMYNESGSPTITNCIFKYNKADYMGGGICNAYNSSPIMTNCIFAYNSAYHGGGIHNYYHSNPILTNCVFSNNSASLYGGGIFNFAYSQPTLINCTLNGNLANRGGALYNNTHCDGTVTNCIFWDNQATSQGNEIYNNYSYPTVRYCDIKGGLNNSPGCGGAHSIDGGDNIGGNIINDDPLFVDTTTPLGHGLRLRDGSPCIDKADDNVAPDSDILGQGRVGTADIGAYELHLNDECQYAFRCVVNHEYRGSITSGESRWYLFIPKISRSVDISLCGSNFQYQSTLTVYDGCEGNKLVYNDGSTVCPPQAYISAFDVEAGNTYIIKVAGSPYAEGNYVLTISTSELVENGDFEAQLNEELPYYIPGWEHGAYIPEWEPLEGRWYMASGNYMYITILPGREELPFPQVLQPYPALPIIPEREYQVQFDIREHYGTFRPDGAYATIGRVNIPINSVGHYNETITAITTNNLQFVIPQNAASRLQLDNVSVR